LNHFILTAAVAVVANATPWTSFNANCSNIFDNGAVTHDCYEPALGVFSGLGPTYGGGSNTLDAWIGIEASNIYDLHHFEFPPGGPYDEIIESFASVTATFVGMTLGPVRPGFAEIVGYGDADGIFLGTATAFASGTLTVPDGTAYSAEGHFMGYLSPHFFHDVPFTLGVPFTLSFSGNSHAWSGRARPENGGIGGIGSWGSSAEVSISGIWDEAGNPVRIYAASELPEPGYCGVVGVFILVAAYAIRRTTRT
jgi:hypothetical protein